MNLQEILLSSSGIIFVVLTLVQVTPLKVNPWSAIARTVGKALNKEVMEELQTIREAQRGTREILDDHIRVDDERNADLHRVQILRFSRDLLRENIPHTQEDFAEALSEIDFYEKYCKEHPEYENNRAVLAIRNIKRAYSERLEKHDFA